jgi:hypothetical protein
MHDLHSSENNGSEPAQGLNAYEKRRWEQSKSAS